MKNRRNSRFEVTAWVQKRQTSIKEHFQNFKSEPTAVIYFRNNKLQTYTLLCNTSRIFLLFYCLHLYYWPLFELIICMSQEETGGWFQMQQVY